MDEDRPICKKCSGMVAMKGGNTSNLLSHLRNAHPEIYRRMKGDEERSKLNEKTTAAAEQQQMQEGAIVRGAPYARNSKRWERLTNVLHG